MAKAISARNNVAAAATAAAASAAACGSAGTSARPGSAAVRYDDAEYVIPPRLLSNLRKHKYSAVDYSLVSKYIMQPYWTWAASKLPEWMHPNIVTLIGFGFMLAALAVLLVHMVHREAGEQLALPSWCYLLFAVCVFAYQTFDAIDGKQARKTGTSSPLGELFDHGCDALNAGIMVLLQAAALQMLDAPYFTVLYMSIVVVFYAATWETYYTGTLSLGYVSGPVEGILLLAGLLLALGAAGPVARVSTLLPVLRGIYAYSGAAIGAACFVSSVWRVVQSARDARARRDALAHLAFFSIEMALLGCWQLRQPAGSWRQIAGLVAATLQHGEAVGRVVVAHCVCDEFPWSPANLGAMGLLYALSGVSVARDEVAVALWLLVAAARYVRFATRVTKEITDELGIRAFSIAPKAKAAHRRAR